MRLAAAAAWAMLAWAAVAAGASAAEPSPDVSAEMRRLLATPVDVGPRSISPKQLFADIQRQVPGLKIVVDPRMAAGGEDFKDRSIGFAARRIPASEALMLALGNSYGWEVRSDGVWICFRENLRELSIVRYPMARLLSPRLPTGRLRDPSEVETDVTELSAIVMRTVESRSLPQVAAWMDEGGPAELQWAGSNMLVSQTREGHQRIAELLLALSRGLGLEYDGPMPERRSEDPAAEEVRRLLARRIDLDFESVGLKDALNHIRTLCPELTFIVDPQLALDGEKSKGRRLCAKVKGIPIGEALSYCLKPAFGWVARPGYVLITDLDHLLQELPAAIYPVRDLVSLPAENGYPQGSQELIAAIQRYVSSQADENVAPWSDEGGPAAIEFMRGMLVVTQTRHGHEQVDRMLRLVRSAVDFAKAQSSRPRAAVPCFAYPEDPLLVATYDALETRMDVDFKDTPFMEAIGVVAEHAPRLNVAIEHTANLPVRVALNRQGATRQSILEELIWSKDLIWKKAGCQAQRGYVVVKAEEWVCPRLILAAYPVSGIIRGFSSSDVPEQVLERAIDSAVNHDRDPAVATWADEGGPASIESFMGVLLITQTPQAHRQISDVLQELRFRGRAAGPVP